MPMVSMERSNSIKNIIDNFELKTDCMFLLFTGSEVWELRY